MHDRIKMEKEKINKMSSSLRKLVKAIKCRVEYRRPVERETGEVQPSGSWQEMDGTLAPSYQVMWESLTETRFAEG